MDRFGMYAKIIAKPGQREALVEHLIEASRLVTPLPGCEIYIVNVEPSDPDAVWVTEIWRSAAEHDESLKMESVKALIARAKPLIAGGSPPIRLTPVGGKEMATADNGVVKIPSRHSVEQTVDRIREMLRTKGIKLFAVVDHSGEAEEAGLNMRPTRLLIFGNPKAGTPLMVASPASALDLPLKILVAEDERGKVSISYNSPQYLRGRHGIPEDLVSNITVVEALAAGAAQ